MLEAVINISEGRRHHIIERIGGAAGDHLLDVHADPDHHRAVLTLAGPGVEEAAWAVVVAAVAELHIEAHAGAHPRLGVADVVPFVPLAATPMAAAVAARDRLAERAGRELGLPCFLYGPERSLPEVRSRAFLTLAPDVGPADPHPTAGACCVGARPVLVAYNLWLAPPATVADARRIATALRGPAVRALGFELGGHAQVSCNLIAPLEVGPAAVFDTVAAQAPIARAELVGLAPEAVLAAQPAHRWAELDLDASRTIEARLQEAGLDAAPGGRG